MNSILFLVGRFGIGGVERATISLANAMVERGDVVCIVAFDFCADNIATSIDHRVEVLNLSGGVFSFSNLQKMRVVIEQKKIRFIINQWCLPVHVSLFCKLASRGLDVKLLAVHHTMPNRNARMMGARNNFLRLVWRLLAGISLHIVHSLCDAYIVLSPSYMEIFKSFAWVKSARKIKAVPNPVVVGVDEGCQKESRVLYVGRLTNLEKRVDRVVSIWNVLYKRLPDWHLDIVGDGDDCEVLKQQAQGIERITFHGFKDPRPFYEKAKILLLTSDFEGFPMAVVEGMTYGCVPFIYASFPAAYDIVRGGEVLVSPPFDADRFANVLYDIASDEVKLRCMAKKARTIIREFGICSILEKWDSVFNSL